MNLQIPLFLSAEDVCRALPMKDAIAAMRDAFCQLANGQVTLPPRQHLPAPDGAGVALVMPCISASLKLFSVKLVTVFHKNAERGLPIVQSLVMLTDGVTGSPLAMLDGASLTAIRTGAASGLATDLLARPDANTVAIFGAGVQARTQLEAVCHVRPIRQARVFARHAAATSQFASEMSQRLSICVEPADSPADALRGADIICAATSSSTPVFDDAELPAGAHINAIGSYRPDMTEIPAATICRARVVVDQRTAVLAEAGDLIVPMQQGMITESHFHAEIGDVVLDREPGRGSPDQITVFKSVGIAIQDLCAAATALDNARRLELGVQKSASIETSSKGATLEGSS